MTVEEYCERIGNLIGKDELDVAIQELHQLLKNSPRLDEAILQSARYNDVLQQIRQGTITSEEANTTKNKIRLGILNLLSEITTQAEQEEPIRAEITKFQSSDKTSINHSKNVVNNSTFRAGGHIIIGDHNLSKGQDGDE